MKPSEIEVGKTYCNAGKGTTRRNVMEIRTDLNPLNPWVRYLSIETGFTQQLRLYSFAKWAGREVEE